MAPPRCLVIALDSLDAGLASRWMDAGRLPALSALRETAARGPVEILPGSSNDALWTSFHTGAVLARHGRFHPKQIQPGSYRVRAIRETDVTVRPFWEQLSRAGRRVAVLDAPKAPLAPELRGFQIADWDSHDHEYEGGPRSVPAAWTEEVVARFGADPIGPCDAHPRGPDDLRRLADGLVRRVDAKAAVACELLAREAWDLAFVGFGSPHCAGHQLWHVHDPDHPDHDAALRRALGDPLEATAVALDRATARLLEAAGPETWVLVVALPGFGPVVTGNPLLDEVLRRLEPAGAARPPAAWRALRAGRRALLPARLPGWLARASHAASEATLARERRMAFALPSTGHFGAVRFNLAGREPGGRLQPGDELDRWSKEVAAALAELVVPDTGRPAVRRVVRTADFHAGPRRDVLPDLIVEWALDGPIRAVRSARVGTVRRDPPPPRTGDHRDRGLFLLRGPGVTPGPREAVPVHAFAPSLAARLGVSLPDADPAPLDWISLGAP